MQFKFSSCGISEVAFHNSPNGLACKTLMNPTCAASWQDRHVQAVQRWKRMCIPCRPRLSKSVAHSECMHACSTQQLSLGQSLDKVSLVIVGLDTHQRSKHCVACPLHRFPECQPEGNIRYEASTRHTSELYSYVRCVGSWQQAVAEKA